MQMSSSIKSLAESLAKAQGEMRAAEMNARNPFLKNRYADLGSIIESAKPVLVKHGLSVSQPVTGSAEFVGVTTLLMHASGEWISETVTLPIGEEKGKSMAQVAGSIITYLRRYSLASILGVYADEDTDGNRPQKRDSDPQVDPEPAPDVPVVERPAPSPAPGAKPSKAMMERWGKLYDSAVELGLTVEKVDYSKITAEELAEKGHALKLRIIKAEEAITASQPPDGRAS